MFVWTGEGSTVNLAGEFNAWSTSADPMAKQPDGTFSLTKKLAAGRYGYKFVVDGNWKADPSVTDGVDDGFGGKNSVVTVGGAAAPATAVAAAAPAKRPHPPVLARAPRSRRTASCSAGAVAAPP